MHDMLALIMVLIATITGAFGSIYLKKASKKFNLNILKQLRNTHLIIGLSLFIFGTIFYVYALSLGSLSIIYPLTSLSYIWISFLSVKILNERMNSYKWIGIALIIIGVTLIMLSKNI